MQEEHTPDTPETTEKAENIQEVVADTNSAEEVAQLKDQLIRALAETENVRKRADREKADMSKYAVTGFARDILAIGDNLSRALSTIEDTEIKDPKVTALIDGIKLTEQTLAQVLEQHGIKKIDPQGEKFNHEFHQAMSEVESDEEPGTIIEVYQQGYVIHDRLLRAAMVAVSKQKILLN